MANERRKLMRADTVDIEQMKRLFSSITGRENLEGTKIICPHCGADSILIDESWATFGARLKGLPQIAGHEVITVGGARCAGCSGLIATASVTKDDVRSTVYLWPREVRVDRAPEHLDANIKKAYDEARQVLSLSPQAAAVLTRRCLQHVIRTKLNIKRKSLFDEIAEAVTRDELTKNTRGALDHIRAFGNWGAHPELDQALAIIEVTADEAQYTLDVLELLFEDLYQRPAEIARMNEAISKRKKT